MKYNQLNLSTKKAATRVGRGISGGKGKTAGRGTKGQGSRKSGGVRSGFEGGQTPLTMRLPKLRGFKSKRVSPENVYSYQLELVKSPTVDATALYEAGLISSPYINVKLIKKGDLTVKKTVKLQFISSGAEEQVKKAGGEFIKTERLARQAKKPTPPAEKS